MDLATAEKGSIRSRKVKARNNDKHGGQDELTGWHDMVGKYREAIRYLRQQNLPTPHPDIMRKGD